MAVLVGASGLAWTIVVIVLIVLFLLWLYCLADILLRRDHGIGWKILWALVTIVLAPIAIPVYLIFVRGRGQPEAAT